MGLLTAVLLCTVLLLVVVFSVVVGMRDAPNAIALPVRWRALTPASALLLAAGLNVLGAVMGWVLVSLVPADVRDLVPEGPAGLLTLACSLLAATGWGLLTWWKGVPSSSTHALAAGILGAGLALTITGDIPDDGGAGLAVAVGLVLVLVISPGVAAVLSWALVFPGLWYFRESAERAGNHSARMSLAVTGGANALGHGLQVGQWVTVVAVLALVAGGQQDLVGWWIAVVVGILLACGTLLGGWRIAFTLTERLVRLDPLRAGVASFTSAALLFVGTFALQLPLSTTHTATGAIVGAGANLRYASVGVPQVLRLALYWAATLVVCAAVSLILAAAGSPLL